MFNTTLHGLDLKCMAQVLWTLSRQGYVEFLSHEHRPFVPDSRAILTDVLIRDIQLAQRHENFRIGHRYSITARGLSRWEAYAKPDWSRYRGEGIYDFESLASSGMWSQTASTETFSREVLQVMASYECVDLAWDQSRITHLTPWEPMRGKTLPHGVTINVPATRRCDELSEIHSDESFSRLTDICRWYERSVINHPDCPYPLT